MHCFGTSFIRQLYDQYHNSVGERHDDNVEGQEIGGGGVQADEPEEEYEQWKPRMAGRKHRQSLPVALSEYDQLVVRSWALGTATSSGTPQTVPNLKTTLAHEGFSAKNEDWNSVQHGVIALFQGRKLPSMALPNLQQNIRNLVTSEVGPFIYDYYKNQLVKKGMRILRDSIKSEEGMHLLHGLGELWNRFFTSILPMLQAIFHPIERKDLSVRDVTLSGFRDLVLLNSGLEVVLMHPGIEIPPATQQMLLVLQGVHDNEPPSENYLKLERLVAQVIVPYLGVRGLYHGGTEPIALAQGAEMIRSRSDEDLLSTPSKRTTYPCVGPSRPPRHQRQFSVQVPSMAMHTLREETLDMRRHSFNIVSS